MSPLLVIAYGNPSRGDDALGPLLAERIGELLPSNPEWEAVEILVDFQLQIEHALDLADRRRVLFVDAAASGAAPCSLVPLTAGVRPGPLSHALSPAVVLSVYRDHFGSEPPSCSLLAIRGYGFELGAPLSDGARANLDAAMVLAREWLDQSAISSRPGR